MKDGVKELLLKVADEIEADENYSGKNWWNNELHTGCAMSRITFAGGAEFVEQEDPDDTRFKLAHFSPSGLIRTDWAMHWVEEASAFVTGINDDFWADFRGFSLNADRFDTAKILRLIANDTYDITKTIKGNVEIVH
jgi:hypothetical protein